MRKVRERVGDGKGDREESERERGRVVDRMRLRERKGESMCVIWLIMLAVTPMLR